MIIALCGLKGSGKTTLAELLTKQGYTKISFAGPIKAMSVVLLHAQGMPYQDIAELFPQDKEMAVDLLDGHSLRHTWQTLGTEWGRKCMGEDLWVNMWRRTVVNIGHNIVSDDMRFLNEAKMVKSLNGILIRIERPGIELDPRHISELEQEMIKVDHTIVNDGDPRDMLRELKHLLGSAL